ncbi:hypothetical protein HDC34_003171 [Pseudoclavibacter sp. JAI123]|uniref:hypothetical protein n=1 Tax=Pseudoclavibacter sp. JAI123 TaxID=2723065 RepID=UPI0015CD9383|nr:hypothetical protein [Pseudoclavibacter sp. JAI123]NYF14836.1 hypothetical protein [Pseudoclavibacter sp. JAI123]
MHAHPQQVTGALLALNGANVPYVFHATPTGFTGTWNYADAKWAGVFAAGAVDRTFEALIELHEDGTFTITNQTQSSSASIGPGSAGFSHTTFKARSGRRASTAARHRSHPTTASSGTPSGGSSIATRSNGQLGTCSRSTAGPSGSLASGPSSSGCSRTKFASASVAAR